MLQVETADGSAPALSLLLPLDAGEAGSYWRAPPDSTNVEFAIVLGTLSIVSGIILLVSSCGYSTFDIPIVRTYFCDACTFAFGNKNPLFVSYISCN